MRVFEEYKDWYKVRLDNGTVGYVQKDDVGVSWVTVIHIPYVPPRDFSWKPKPGKSACPGTACIPAHPT